jgi:hypothetical protein
VVDDRPAEVNDLVVLDRRTRSVVIDRETVADRPDTIGREAVAVDEGSVDIEDFVDAVRRVGRAARSSTRTWSASCSRGASGT